IPLSSRLVVNDDAVQLVPPQGNLRYHSLHAAERIDAGLHLRTLVRQRMRPNPTEEETHMRHPGAGLIEQLTLLPDGRTMRSVTGGSSGPLVVLEAGLGNPAATWVTVQRALS